MPGSHLGSFTYYGLIKHVKEPLLAHVCFDLLHRPAGLWLSYFIIYCSLLSFLHSPSLCFYVSFYLQHCPTLKTLYSSVLKVDVLYLLLLFILFSHFHLFLSLCLTFLDVYPYFSNIFHFNNFIISTLMH